MSRGDGSPEGGRSRRRRSAQCDRFQVMSHTLFELDIRLREIEPPIWRTVEVPGAWSLEAVHLALQVAMGWTNSHLHQFKIGDKLYGMVDVDDDGDLEIEDEKSHFGWRK